jgi:histidinol-phosphate/aromatic aminotransferase/cobyric acid decarboxylase-like protein
VAVQIVQAVVQELLDKEAKAVVVTPTYNQKMVVAVAVKAELVETLVEMVTAVRL